MEFIKPVDAVATLENAKQLTHDVWQYDFSMPANAIPYKTGQFVMMNFESEGESLQRAYSISSPANVNGFQLCVKLIPEGRGSNHFQQMQIGDEVNFKGPFGMFYVKDQRDLLLVATGTGIAPMKGIVEHLLSQGDERQINLIFGVRYEEDIFWQQLFNDLAAKHHNFNFILTVSRPTDNWQGTRGRVTDHLSEFNFADENLAMFICGNNDMVKSLRQFALDQGMEKRSIHVENFG